MRQAFKFRIDPSPAVEAKLKWTLDVCRELYNAGLQERRDAYRMCGVSLTYRRQADELAEVKEVRPDVALVHSQVLQDVLKRVDHAFEGFFRRVAAGEQPGYPRFQGKTRYDSFTFPQSGFRLEGDKLHMSKIGSVRMRISCPIKGKIKTLTIKREGDKWFAVFSCEFPDPVPSVEKESQPLKVVGIDVGLESFVTDDQGNKIENPRFFRQTEAKLKQAQRRLSRKKKRSGHYRRQARKVARLHHKVSNQRQDFLHKLSRKLVNTFDIICFENLNVAGMVRNGHLAKSISDASWSMFLAMLVYKAAYAGKQAVNVNPRYTSQECSGCHNKVPKSLSVRWHNCPYCDVSLDRDHNAALNIRARGIELLLAAGLAVTAPGGLAWAGPMKGEPGESFTGYPVPLCQ